MKHEINIYNSLTFFNYFTVNRWHYHKACHGMEGQKSVWAVLCPIWPSSSDCWTKTFSRLTNEDTSRRSEQVLQENMKQQMDIQNQFN